MTKLDQLRDWWEESDYRIEVVDYYFNRTKLAPFVFFLFYGGTILLIIVESLLLFSNTFDKAIEDLSILVTAIILVALLLLQRRFDNWLMEVYASHPVPIELQIEAIDRFFSGLFKREKKEPEINGAKYLMKEVWDNMEDKESEPAQKLWRAMAALDAYSLRTTGTVLDDEKEEEE